MIRKITEMRKKKKLVEYKKCSSLGCILEVLFYQCCLKGRILWRMKNGLAQAALIACFTS